MIIKKQISAATENAGKVSPEVLDLIDKMLVKDPDDRLALIDVLHHPWVINDTNFVVQT
jgi:serine/threonine protein kinase